MPFSEKSLQFLFENALKDDKNWYNEHKNDYKQYISEPFAEFITALQPTIFGIDEQLMCNPKRISRLYRDTRFSKDKSLFRDNVWCTFGRKTELYESLPCYYFDMSPRGFSYGCGYYMTSRESMDAIRTLILKDDKAYLAAQKALDKQKTFVMYGDMYKRNRYPAESEKKCFWLNRKTIGLSCDSDDFGLLYSDKLAKKISDDFKAIEPFYAFLMKAEELATAVKQHSK